MVTGGWNCNTKVVTDVQLSAPVSGLMVKFRSNQVQYTVHCNGEEILVTWLTHTGSR